MTKQNLCESRNFLKISLLVSVLLSYSSIAANTDIETTSADIYGKGDDSVDSGLKRWNPYTRLMEDEFGEENSEEKRGSGFYPLRGKKSDSEESRMSFLYPLLTKSEETKKALSFVPVRGRKASYFVPTRGRKASAFTPMRGKKGESSRDSDPPNWENNIAAENGRGSSSVTSERGIVGDMELSMQESYMKNGDQTLSDGLDKRGANFFGSRGKRKIVFPFITTWRVFQRLQSQPESKGSKREALFFASRGKRDFHTA